MWTSIRSVFRNALYITLPLAGLIGFVGYNLENLISDKHTPHTQATQEHRAERLTANLEHPEKLLLKENVLETNLSPSLKSKAIL